MRTLARLGPAPVALESTLLLHGVPRAEAPDLARRLDETIRAEGATPVVAAVISGRPRLGLDDAELAELLSSSDIPKVNTANLGLAVRAGRSAATTVSTTMEIAASAGVSVFATGGLGGVHRDYGRRFDISADLAALARFPVAVVASGVKSLLDVVATREALESLGIPVVGFQTDMFPAFYLADSGARVDARFDDARELADFLAFELARTRRGVLVAHAAPPEHQIDPERFQTWLDEAEVAASQAAGRDVTPAVLAELHRISGGATLRTNVELVVSNARLGARLAVAWPEDAVTTPAPPLA